MGTKRAVDTDLWTDEKVEGFTPEEKFFWVYLLTNPYVKQLGIYHITKKQMAFQLGYDVETVSKLLDRFEREYKMILYVDSELAILNYLKRSVWKGGKPFEDCLVADIKNVKNKELIDAVFKHILEDNIEVNETVYKVINNYNNNNIHIHIQNRSLRFVDDSSSYRDSIPTYDTSKNKVMSEEEEEELKKLMKGKQNETD